MAFVPVVKSKHLGKRTNNCQRRPVDFLYHAEGPSLGQVHTHKKTYPPKAHRLQDDLSIPHGGRGRPMNANLASHNPFTGSLRAPGGAAMNAAGSNESSQHQQQPWRSQSSLDYVPMERRRDEEAKWFAEHRGRSSILSPTVAEGGPAKFGMRLAPLTGHPPPQCEIPGFRGMGNPIFIVPNERPNQEAAVRTSSVPLRELQFFGERRVL